MRSLRGVWEEGRVGMREWQVGDSAIVEMSGAVGRWVDENRMLGELWLESSRGREMRLMGTRMGSWIMADRDGRGENV